MSACNYAYCVLKEPQQNENEERKLTNRKICSASIQSIMPIVNSVCSHFALMYTRMRKKYRCHLVFYTFFFLYYLQLDLDDAHRRCSLTYPVLYMLNKQFYAIEQDHQAPIQQSALIFIKRVNTCVHRIYGCVFSLHAERSNLQHFSSASECVFFFSRSYVLPTFRTKTLHFEIFLVQ